MNWEKRSISLQELNSLSTGTLGAHLGMKFTEITDTSLVATMPVDERTHQPYGLLHGGASAALAETVGSVASWMSVNPDTHLAVGIEINCNHVRGVRTGVVTATATPLHIGLSTHVWDIRITDEKARLVCISRLTVAIVKKKD
ncbi:MAG: hotdog fold thioesterase [Chitinophagia bacterium]|nr:hotdog fold thioesterase [Chitinophagia bacterium]